MSELIIIMLVVYLVGSEVSGRTAGSGMVIVVILEVAAASVMLGLVIILVVLVFPINIDIRSVGLRRMHPENTGGFTGGPQLHCVCGRCGYADCGRQQRAGRDHRP
ncbi:hypothetical protein GCM10029978_107860 [Actinoallomurus acanthiterrae]